MPVTLFCIVTSPTGSLFSIIPFYVFLFICFTLILIKSSKKFFEKSYSLDRIGTGITLDPFAKFINTLFSLLLLGYPFNILCAPKRSREPVDDEGAPNKSQKNNNGDGEDSSTSSKKSSASSSSSGESKQSSEVPADAGESELRQNAQASAGVLQNAQAMGSPDPLAAVGSFGHALVEGYNGVRGRQSDQVLQTAQASSELAGAAATYNGTVQNSSRSEEEKEEASSNANECIGKASQDVQKARDLRDSSEISLPTVTEETVNLVAGANAITP